MTTTFHRLSELPPELRQEIWILAESASEGWDGRIFCHALFISTNEHPILGITLVGLERVYSNVLKPRKDDWPNPQHDIGG
jgi:hypothetical protein